jgi:hypothetical protein
MIIRLILPLLLISIASHAQYITGIGTKWSDEFTEWNIYTDDEDLVGEITMRWQMQRDWTEWDFNLGDESGTIKLKWKNDPNLWEINGNNELITARTLWKDDASEWRITNNSQSITLKRRWNNNFNEWSLKSDKHGEFDIITDWEGDPREWIVKDDLDEDISDAMKVAILFLVTFHSSPKG